MPKGDKSEKAKRRLLDIRVDEVSLVDNPANDEEFLLIKREAQKLPEQHTEKAENAMGPKIKAALEAKGMTLEQLAEATQIGLEKLQKATEDREALSEEELGKVATALDIEKFDDPAEKEGEEGQATEQEPEDEAKQEGEADSKVQMLHEKLNALVALTSEVAAILADMGVLQQRDADQEKSEDGDSDDAGEQSSEQLNPEVDVTKAALDQLTAVLTSIKDALTQKGAEEPAAEADKKVEKSEDGEVKDKIDISDYPEVVEMRKQLEDMQKKLDGFEKSGVTKSLGDDDSTSSAVKKDADECEWGFFGDDFKD